MKIVRIAIFAAVIACGTFAAYAGDSMSAETSSAQADGEKMERLMWEKIKAGDWAAVEAMVAPGFQSVHEDGARDRAQELKLMKGLELGKVEFSDFKSTTQGDTIIVTYNVEVTETIAGQKLANPVPMPRQSVWLKTPAGWQWIAHANLNAMMK